MNDTVRVSVITPLLNGGDFIGTAIRSLEDQGVPIEHIVVDGGSSDDGVSVARSMGRSEVVVRSGLSSHAAINLAIESCTGEFVGVLNSDDVLLPGAIGAAVSALDAGPQIDMACGAFQYVGVNADAGPPLYTRWRAAPADLTTELTLGVPGFNSWLFRRAFLKNLRGIDCSLEYSGDRDLLIRAAAHGRLATLDRPVYRYLVHNGSRTMSRRRETVRAIALEHLEIVEKSMNDARVRSMFGHILPTWQAIEEARLAWLDTRRLRFGALAQRVAGTLADPAWPYRVLRARRLRRRLDQAYVTWSSSQSR